MGLELVVGLEIHVQMSTKTKMFCRCDNDSFNKVPNINVCPVCMGFPGQLPVLNEEAVFKGVKTALALNCKINNFSKFDRKNYFYPDNPKGYQISQYDEPVSENGFLEVDLKDSSVKKIGITRLHLEDDAGKLTHYDDLSLIDFNRAGTPLMEIVSEPDIRSSEEAVLYAQEIQKIVRYVGASDADMEKGMMRFDASVSIRPRGEEKLYPRAEIKNLNSFRALKAAIDYEFARQSKLWQEKNPIKVAQTLGWDDSELKTYFMREKEDSDDYRYFPEPDIPPILFSDEEIDKIKEQIPTLPREKKRYYLQDLSLKEDDARILSEDIKISEYFDEVYKLTDDLKMSVSFITTILMKYLKEDLISVDQQRVSAKIMADLINLVKDSKVSNSAARNEVFEELYKNGGMPLEVVERLGLVQLDDDSALLEIVDKIISANPDSIEDIKNGKDRAIGFLIGLVMKETKGRANPKKVSELINTAIKNN